MGARGRAKPIRLITAELQRSLVFPWDWSPIEIFGGCSREKKKCYGCSVSLSGYWDTEAVRSSPLEGCEFRMGSEPGCVVIAGEAARCWPQWRVHVWPLCPLPPSQVMMFLKLWTCNRKGGKILPVDGFAIREMPPAWNFNWLSVVVGQEVQKWCGSAIKEQEGWRSVWQPAVIFQSYNVWILWGTDLQEHCPFRSKETPQI